MSPCSFEKHLSEVRLTNFYTIKMTMSCKPFVRQLGAFSSKTFRLRFRFCFEGYSERAPRTSYSQYLLVFNSRKEYNVLSLHKTSLFIATDEVSLDITGAREDPEIHVQT